MEDCFMSLDGGCADVASKTAMFDWGKILMCRRSLLLDWMYRHEFSSKIEMEEISFGEGQFFHVVGWWVVAAVLSLLLEM